jgi:CHAT domain-containing protein
MNELNGSAAHPDPENLGAFAEGRLNEAMTREITMHISACNQCLDALGGAVRFGRGERGVEIVTKRLTQRATWLAAAAAILAVIGLGTFRELLRRSGDSQLARLAAAAPRDYRVVEPRLTGFRWAPVRAYRDPASTLWTNEPAYLRMAGAAGEVLEKVRIDSSPETLHAAGVAKLLLHDPAGAVGILETATTRTPDDPHAWSDLAAAQLTLAIQQRRPSVLPLALASEDRALKLDHGLRDALFNRALILENMGLTADAAEAWRAYLTVDADSDWAHEARENLNRLMGPKPGAFKQRVGDIERAAWAGDAVAVRRIVDLYRQEARAYCEVEGLGQWSEAVRSGNATAAAMNLMTVRMVGEALVRLNGESLLSDAVRIIDDASPDPRRTRQLAMAHATYREGRLLYSKQKLPRAERVLSDAADMLASTHSPMEGVARYYVANVIFDQNRVGTAKVLLQQLAVSDVATSHPALLAQVEGQIGLCEGYEGHWHDALSALDSARTRFASLGETGLLSSVESNLAEVYEFLGQPDRAWEHRIPVFRELSNHPIQDRLISALAGATRGELRAERLASALALIDTQLRHASQANNALIVADAQRRRCIIHRRMGDTREAWIDLRQVRTTLTRIADSGLRDRLNAELLVAEGDLRREFDPQRAIALYTAAIDFYAAAGQRFYLPEALLERARAWRHAGSVAESARDLDAGILELEAQRTAASKADLRTGLFDQQSSLFEEAVDLAITRGDLAAAFQYADGAHGRTLLDAAASRTGADVLAVQRALRPGETVLELTLVPDGVATFVVRPNGIFAFRQQVLRRDLEGRVSALRSAIEQREDEKEIRRKAAALFVTVFESSRASLSGTDSLILVGDRFLQRIPFAALYDASRDRWFVEDFALTIAPSAAVWASAEAQRSEESVRSPHALVVSDQGSVDAPPLMWTVEEGREVAALYPMHRILGPGEATVPRFLADSPLYDVVHFAGHARAEGIHDSALLLTRDDEGASALTTEVIAMMDLRRTRLVVLAACGTAAADSSSMEGMPSLARAFLAAGVPSVVGSLWPIDDKEAAAIVIEFHRQLSRGSDTSHALRNAQLLMMRQRRPSSRHPAAWAALEVVGASIRI